jgi:hypothetical protein
MDIVVVIPSAAWGAKCDLRQRLEPKWLQTVHESSSIHHRRAGLSATHLFPKLVVVFSIVGDGGAEGERLGIL